MSDDTPPGPGAIPVETPSGVTLYGQTATAAPLQGTVTGIQSGVADNTLNGNVGKDFTGDPDGKEPCPLLVPQVPLPALPPPHKGGTSDGNKPLTSSATDDNTPLTSSTTDNNTPVDLKGGVPTPQTLPSTPKHQSFQLHAEHRENVPVNLVARVPQTATPKTTKTTAQAYWARTKYGSGPVLTATATLRQCGAWPGLMASGTITPQQQNIILSVSGNEGGADALQGWDNQVLTLGSMQKTISPDGSGELPNQVYTFSQNNPSAYNTLFVQNGWSVRSSTVVTKKGKKVTAMRMYYENSTYPDGITGKALKNYMRSLQSEYKAAGGKGLAPELLQMLQPLQAAAINPAFQKQQILDWQSRLNSTLNKKSNGSTLRSWAGNNPQLIALLLDESVNRPGSITNAGRNDFGRALQAFFAAPQNSDVPPSVLRNPSLWTPQQRANFEQQIINDYRNTRKDKWGNTKNRMTDPLGRANKIRKYFAQAQ